MPTAAVRHGPVQACRFGILAGPISLQEVPKEVRDDESQRSGKRGRAPWWPRARVCWRRMRARAPSRSASTRSSWSPPKSIAAPTARCCSRHPGHREWISGVILYDETIRQKTRDGVTFPDYLTKLGVMPGIKVDTGAKPLAGFPGETITEGLDGLRERLMEYYKLGARFAKWRAVIDIGAGIPTRLCDRGQRAGAGPLCGAVPGTEDRADRRARSADGRRAHHRALRGGHGCHAAGGVRPARTSTASTWKA